MVSLHLKDGGIHQPPDVVRRYEVPRPTFSLSTFKLAIKKRDRAVDKARSEEETSSPAIGCPEQKSRVLCLKKRRRGFTRSSLMKNKIVERLKKVKFSDDVQFTNENGLAVKTETNPEDHEDISNRMMGLELGDGKDMNADKEASEHQEPLETEHASNNVKEYGEKNKSGEKFNDPLRNREFLLTLVEQIKSQRESLTTTLADLEKERSELFGKFKDEVRKKDEEERKRNAAKKDGFVTAPEPVTIPGSVVPAAPTVPIAPAASPSAPPVPAPSLTAVPMAALHATDTPVVPEASTAALVSPLLTSATRSAPASLFSTIAVPNAIQPAASPSAQRTAPYPVPPISIPARLPSLFSEPQPVLSPVSQPSSPAATSPGPVPSSFRPRAENPHSVLPREDSDSEKEEGEFEPGSTPPQNQNMEEQARFQRARDQMTFNSYLTGRNAHSGVYPPHVPSSHVSGRKPYPHQLGRQLSGQRSSGSYGSQPVPNRQVYRTFSSPRVSSHGYGIRGGLHGVHSMGAMGLPHSPRSPFMAGGGGYGGYGIRPQNVLLGGRGAPGSHGRGGARYGHGSWSRQQR